MEKQLFETLNCEPQLRNATLTQMIKGEFFGEIIEKHKKELDPVQPKDFIDVYLLEADKNGEVIFSFVESSVFSHSP